MKSQTTIELRLALVHIGEALTAIEEAGPPSPALFAVVKDLRASRTDLLNVVTAIERARKP